MISNVVVFSQLTAENHLPVRFNFWRLQVPVTSKFTSHVCSHYYRSRCRLERATRYKRIDSNFVGGALAAVDERPSTIIKYALRNRIISSFRLFSLVVRHASHTLATFIRPLSICSHARGLAPDVMKLIIISLWHIKLFTSNKLIKPNRSVIRNTMWTAVLKLVKFL